MSPDQLSVFLTYTERFDKVFSEFPNAFRKTGEFSQNDKNPKTEQAAIRFFNLCAEEFYLAAENLIASDVWDAWKTQIGKTVSHDLISAVWREVREEYCSPTIYGDFVEFMDATVSET